MRRVFGSIILLSLVFGGALMLWVVIVWMVVGFMRWVEMS